MPHKEQDTVMTLPEAGEILHKERISQKLELDDIVQQTKISKINLEAIESGNRENLPHPVYTRGFVQTYALLLKLDPAPFLAALDQQYPAVNDSFTTEHEATSALYKKTLVEQPENAKNLRHLALVFLAFVLLIVTGIFVFTPNFFSSGPAEPSPSSALPAASPGDAADETDTSQQVPDQLSIASESAAAQSAHSTTDQETVPENTPETPADTSLSPQQTAPPVTQTNQEASVQEEQSAPEATAQTPRTFPNTQQIQVAADREIHTLVVTAQEACWLYVEVDAGIQGARRTVVDLILQPGDVRAFRYRREILLRLGNGGGVSLTHDEKPVPVNAESGKVKTVRFVAASL